MNSPLAMFQKLAWGVRSRWQSLGSSQPALEFSVRLGKNALWLSLARLGTQGLMLLFTLLLARRLGEAGLGEYAFLVSVLFLGNILTTFGTDVRIMRQVSSNRDLSGLSVILLLQLSLSALFGGLIFFSAPLLPNQSHEVILALRWYGLALFPLAFYTVFSAVLRGYERMRAFMWLNLAFAALQLGLFWFFIHPGDNILNIVWLLLGSQILTAVLAGYLCYLHIPGFSLAWGNLSVIHLSLFSIFKESAPLALLGLLKVLYQKISVYMLSTLQGASVTGWYAAALRPVEASQIGHIALVGALFPMMAQAYIGREQNIQIQKKIFSFSWWLLLALGTAVAVLLFLMAPGLITLLYGDRFGPAIQALRLLAWVLVPFSINISLSTELLSAGHDRQVAFAIMTGLLVLTVLNTWWIPRWGLIGACLATLSAETIQAGIFLLMRTSGPGLKTTRRSE